MRYMRYVGLKTTLLPHLRQRQQSSIHMPNRMSDLLVGCVCTVLVACCSIAVTCNESECLTDRSGEMSFEHSVTEVHGH
jgi:hypothetical protein